MSFSKESDFTTADRVLSIISQGFSHPARVMILRRLVTARGQFVEHRKLVDGIPLAESTICQHLRLLRDKRLIISRSNGNSGTTHKLNEDLGISRTYIDMMVNYISDRHDLFASDIRPLKLN